MITETGSIYSSSGKQLLKMWESSPAPAKRPLQRHSHPAFEIMAVLSGGGVYETKKGSISFCEGDVFVFSSNETHYITEIGEQGLKMLNLHFEPRYLWGKSYDSPQNLNFCFTHSNDFPICIKSDRAKGIFDKLIAIKTEFCEKSPEYLLSVRLAVCGIVLSLIRDHGYQADSNEVEASRNKSIIKAMDYIDSNLSSPITLASISAVAGNSPTYFSLLFKKVCGITLWDYITAKRIERAVQLLGSDNADLTILDIATRCGFNNTANFNKLFKKHTGMTPRQFRRGKENIMN